MAISPFFRFWNSKYTINALKFLKKSLKKQSDQGLPCLLFWQAVCEFQPWYPIFYWEQKEKICRNFKRFTITALVKDEIVQNIRLNHWFEGGIENCFPRITVWDQEACLVMPNRETVITRDIFFYTILTQIMDLFSCSPLNTAFLFQNKLAEFSEYAKMMTSLGYNNDMTTWRR